MLDNFMNSTLLQPTQFLRSFVVIVVLFTAVTFGLAEWGKASPEHATIAPGQLAEAVVRECQRLWFDEQATIDLGRQPDTAAE